MNIVHYANFGVQNFEFQYILQLSDFFFIMKKNIDIFW